MRISRNEYNHYFFILLFSLFHSLYLQVSSHPSILLRRNPTSINIHPRQHPSPSPLQSKSSPQHPLPSSPSSSLPPMNTSSSLFTTSPLLPPQCAYPNPNPHLATTTNNLTSPAFPSSSSSSSSSSKPPHCRPLLSPPHILTGSPPTGHLFLPLPQLLPHAYHILSFIAPTPLDVVSVSGYGGPGEYWEVGAREMRPLRDEPPSSVTGSVFGEEREGGADGEGKRSAAASRARSRRMMMARDSDGDGGGDWWEEGVKGTLTFMPRTSHDGYISVGWMNWVGGRSGTRKPRRGWLCRVELWVVDPSHHDGGWE